MLNNVEICLQSFGTVLAVFLRSDNKEAIERRHFSFYNHEATNGDLDWWTDSCAMFWIYSSPEFSAEDKLLLAMARGALNEMLNRGQCVKGTNPWPKACEIAIERFEQMEKVRWLVVNVSLDTFDVASSVNAERETGNFDDDVLSAVVMRHGIEKLDLYKHEKTECDN